MNHNNIKKNISLAIRFSQLKLPWWLLIIPIFNNTVYLLIFKSWFLEFDDRNFIFNYYNKEKFLTHGIFFISSVLFFLFSFLYLVFVYLDGAQLWFFTAESLYLFFLSFFVLWNLTFHPINILLRSRKVITAYEKYCRYQNIENFDFNFCETNLISYQISNSFSAIKNHLFDLNYYSLFNPDLEFAQKVRELDIDNAKYLSEVQKNILRHGDRDYIISKVPSTGICFWYLFSTGFWFLGTLNSIYNLLKVRDDFLKKINIIGSFYSIFWYLINLLIIFFIFPIMQKSDFLYLPDFSNSFVSLIKYFIMLFILLFANIVYINIIGLCISIFVRKRLMP